MLYFFYRSALIDVQSVVTESSLSYTSFLSSLQIAPGLRGIMHFMDIFRLLKCSKTAPKLLQNSCQHFDDCWWESKGVFRPSKMFAETFETGGNENNFFGVLDISFWYR